MIRGLERTQSFEPEPIGRVQWWATIVAGITAGVVLLIVPYGTPWGALSFFSPAIMGRPVRGNELAALPIVWVIHLAVSVLYSLIICIVISNLPRPRMIPASGVLGLLLYVANFGIV